MSFMFKSRSGRLALMSFVWGIGLALAWPSTARAQQADAAIIVGTVVDETDRALPGATVTLTHAGTNAVTVVHANERGQYRTPPVRLGTYDVGIELSGFRRFVQRGIVLNIGDVRTVNATLHLGELSETVTVDAVAPLLSSADSTVGTVITNAQIGALPLNGRDYLQLASLSAGTGPQSGQGVIIGGQSGTQVAFLLDGQDNNNQQISTGHTGQKEIVKPSVDSIQEFKVVTNGYSAEYGRSSSGVVSVSLKSGSNQLRGVAYEFFRDDRWDSKSYFAAAKPDYNRHQFGGAAGFPVLRDRTFFFGDFEQGIIRRESATVSTLPATAIRGGQFATSIRDPLTGQPFPNNRVPADRLDPVAARILQYLPQPQTAAATNNYVYNSPSDQYERRWNARVDHIINPRHNVYFRYSQQLIDVRPNSPLPPDAQGNYVASGAGEISDNRSWVFAYNGVLSPTVVSSVRVGWNKIDWDETVPSQDLRGVGIPGVDSSQPVFSQINITGYRGLGISNVPNDDDSFNRQISGDITWTRGAHTLKAGVQAYWMGIDFYSSQRSSGIFDFNGQYTGDPFADFLLGSASSASLSKWAVLNFRTPYTHVFAQDDWRVGRRLTLNLGLRYELSPPAVDVNDAIGNFDLDTDPANPRIVLGGEEGNNRAGRSTIGVNYHQWAPRLGFAYSLPGDHTVLRGGTGIFYSNMITVGGMSSLEINPPNHVRVSLSTDRNAAPTILLNQGFAPDALDASKASNVTLVSWDRSNKTPTAYQWNLNVQRQLPGRVLVEVGYNANRFVNNWRSIDANWALPGPGNLNSRRRYQTALVPGTDDVITLSSVTRIQKDGWSQYHGLQTKVEKRYSAGVSLLASYTWSKTRGLEGGYQDPNNIDAEIGPTGTDRPHHFVASGVYELPFGRGRTFGRDWNTLTDAVLGGWSVSPIVTLTSGAPLNVTVSGNPSNTGGTDRPNIVGDWRIDNQTPERWFNTAAFAANDQYTFGNAPKNVLRGPGYANLDIVVRKAFQLTGRVTADLRFESFNATNVVNWGNPNTQVGNRLFGVISSAGAARNNQVAVKFSF